MKPVDDGLRSATAAVPTDLEVPRAMVGDDSVFRQYAPDECGKDGYPWRWHQATASTRPIKDQVRELAGHRCIRCGHPYECGRHGNGEWSPCDENCSHDGPVKEGRAQWRILTVHHLDGVKSNCRWWNLAALCQRCHLTIQGRVTMSQVYPFQHSEWFKPYAAGFYALTYLGEELSRAETLARLDELLGLELAV